MIGEGPGKDPREKARQKAWRLLQIRPHSERDLWKKLRERGFQPEVLEDVFEELKRYRYVDDAAYASQTARHLAVDRLLGNRRIVLYLREKGLNTELIAEAVAEARQAFPEEEALRRLIRIKMKDTPLAGREDRVTQKIIRSLWGKGFSTGLILEILKRMKEEEELHDSSRT
jgi:regulatory protein